MNTFSPGVAIAWRIAAHETVVLKQVLIEPAHLMIGVCSLGKALDPHAFDPPLAPDLVERVKVEAASLGEFLQTCGLEPARVRRELRKLSPVGSGALSGGVVHRSDASRMLFEQAEVLAEQLGLSILDCTALGFAMLSHPTSELLATFDALGVPRDKSAAEVARRLMAAPAATAPSHQPGDCPSLAKYGRDLTQLASEGKLSPVIGRRQEMLNVVRALSRTSKNNAILLGEAGVGKTAVVEGLAQRIVDGKALAGRRIVELRMASLVAGTRYRGDLEERVTRILEEVTSHPEIILFLDEIHTLVGAGRAEGAQDVGGMFKQALSGGDLSCIGATTLSEYRQSIEKDPALARRFQTVEVSEPGAEETLGILEGLSPRFEAHHAVRIAPAARQAAVELTVRYMPGRRLPDKALDALDQACAMVQVPWLISGPQGSAAPADGTRVVTRNDVVAVVSEWTGIPIPQSDHDGEKQIRELDEHLRSQIVGQPLAIERVVAQIRKGLAGLRSPRRPRGVFLFLGPTGVGKTALARVLAEHLFGSSDQLVRIDMSEYMEAHAISRLIGAPPGYVGHEQEGQLTGQLRARPFSVVLLDEIEKAHANVFDLFLQLFDDGRLTDGHGRTVDGSHAIYIMTSNLAVGRRLGFEAGDSAEARDGALKEVGRHFRPEFVNRIDEQIIFRSLDEDDVCEIARRYIVGLGERMLREKRIALRVDPDAIALVARAGFDPERGARELLRAVGRMIEEPLSGILLAGKLRAHDTMTVRVAMGRLVFEHGENPTIS